MWILVIPLEVSLRGKRAGRVLLSAAGWTELLGDASKALGIIFLLPHSFDTGVGDGCIRVS
jgi:hypothetical protein